MIITLRTALNMLFNIIEYAIFIDVILSWVYRGRGNSLIDILHIFTEPFMAPARRLQERFVPGGMLDFSPILAYFILNILRYFIVNKLLGMF
ncbi:YggT family protein [Clostridium sp. SYSU_GA19001]|uniref:YggT family protein n=1 Tax=Clostridium caldaquaticum TaxID=2940653 RepID=UPI0020778113|nr:YggT family protein [Clostridium caldaquaticum]MCM8711014.1 YggT family protein [Clostridium caldaquaticum]